MNQIIVRVSLLALIVAIGCSFVDCQFLPQSHLGRLVQSITSPLVLNGESEGSYPESAYYPSGSSQDDGSDAGQQNQPQSQSQAQARPNYVTPSASSNRQKQQHNQLYHQQQAHLQQAPSQQRGIPQHYYGNTNQYDEDRDHGSAPSNNKGTQEYQMGAYLGPTMDDKEINGAFNSNDDRDDDDGPSSYDGNPAPSMGATGSEGQRETGYNNDGSYGPQAGSSAYSNGYERQPTNAANSYGANQYDKSGPYGDEDGADEDDGPSEGLAGNRGRRNNYKGGLNQAASQYQQQGSYGGNGNGNGNGMMTAANGYAPYGFNGPVDLTSMLGGGDPNGYQVYNGDGSYPGQNYYQQQGQRGGRQQAASMNNGYQNQGRNQAGDNDDHDNDDNED